MAGGGALGHALLGDQLAEAAVANGWSGIVVDGAVRDVEILRTLALGVRALGAFPRKTDKRGLGEADLTVQVAGVQIAPGDWLYADASGIVVASTSLQ